MSIYKGNNLIAGQIETRAELLWTNPSPSSDYSGGTINLNLSGYKYVLLYYITETPRIAVEILDVNEEFSLITLNSYWGRTSGRAGRFTSNSIIFDSCYTYNGTTPTAYGEGDVTRLKPYKIYGIRQGTFADLDNPRINLDTSNPSASGNIDQQITYYLNQLGWLNDVID